ncbi:MAG: hypothetical protein EOO08_02790 [Chitinophagaceae bacterium]|nr:MAG: hypothetical protein EOO08_02790 [Chitinophagaceae bacterium]
MRLLSKQGDATLTGGNMESASAVCFVPHLSKNPSMKTTKNGLKIDWHVFPLYLRKRPVQKSEVMKDVMKRMSAANESHEGFHLGTTIMMIFLFLAFWGVSFYILLNSYA